MFGARENFKNVTYIIFLNFSNLSSNDDKIYRYTRYIIQVLDRELQSDKFNTHMCIFVFNSFQIFNIIHLTLIYQVEL